MDTSNDLLSIDGVGHAFGGFRVLSSVSFRVPARALVGLIGPNGSGKTTLFNIVSGFLHQRHGVVVYRGRPLDRLSVMERSRCGLVRTFQTPKVFEHMTVLENVMVGLYKRTRSGLLASMLRTKSSVAEMRSMQEQADAACEKFGLHAVKGLDAGKLTAGQRRNLELARACVGDPGLLLLDEPSSGLSQEEVDELKERLRRLNAEGLAILLVTHDMDLMAVATRVHALSAGEIIASGSMEEIQAHPQVQQVYLGV